MHVGSRAALFVAVAAATACSLVADYDLPLGGVLRRDDAADVVDGREASLAEAAADGAAQEADASMVVMRNFDDPLPACGFSRMDQGTAMPDSDSRTGPGSCRLCATVNGGRIRGQLNVPDPGSGIYVVEAWFKRIVDAGRPPTWSMRLAASLDGSVASDDQAGTLDATWRFAQVTLQVDEPLSVYTWLGAESSLLAGDCVLIDDVAIFYQP